MSKPKIKNRPLERDSFLKFRFPQMLVDFFKILVEISGNRDPLRGKTLDFSDFGIVSETNL